jgi:hypothetical protein
MSITLTVFTNCLAISCSRYIACLIAYHSGRTWYEAWLLASKCFFSFSIAVSIAYAWNATTTADAERYLLVVFSYMQACVLKMHASANSAL